MAKLILLTEKEVPDEVLESYLNYLSKHILQWLDSKALLTNKFQCVEYQEPTDREGVVIESHTTISIMDVQ